MVWDMNDYPSTMKNLDSLVRKKKPSIQLMLYYKMVIQKVVRFQSLQNKHNNGTTMQVQKKKNPFVKKSHPKKVILMRVQKEAENYQMQMLK